MQSTAQTPAEYIASLPDDRRKVMKKLRATFRKHLPKGFEETMGYGMLGFVVPHRLYPAGYHVDPKKALPFVNLASQKNYVAVYHLGLYDDAKLLAWFTKQWPKHTEMKLDLGKSCIRMKKLDEVPYELFGELASKLTPEAWIKAYEKARR